MQSEASFAALCGASPVQASSGRTIRHRLNRGGDRQANNALWRIAITRMRYDQTTIAYAQKRQTEGKKPPGDHPLPETPHRPGDLPPAHRSTRNSQRRPSSLSTQKRANNPHPRRHSPTNLPSTPLTTRARHLPQPSTRHPIPPMAHRPHTPPKLDLTTIGASTPRTPPHRRHKLARHPTTTTTHQNPLSPPGRVEPPIIPTSPPNDRYWDNISRGLGGWGL